MKIDTQYGKKAEVVDTPPRTARAKGLTFCKANQRWYNLYREGGKLYAVLH